MALQLQDRNLYARGFIVDFGNGKSILKRDRTVYTPTTTNDKTHTVKQGDTLYRIAYDSYGDDLYWYLIADVNNVFNPFELTVGTELIIPDLDVIKASRK